MITSSDVLAYRESTREPPEPKACASCRGRGHLLECPCGWCDVPPPPCPDCPLGRYMMRWYLAEPARFAYYTSSHPYGGGKPHPWPYGQTESLRQRWEAIVAASAWKDRIYWFLRRARGFLRRNTGLFLMAIAVTWLLWVGEVVRLI